MAITDRLLSLDRKSVELEDSDKRDKYDCLSCRIIGSTALTSLGVYTYYSGMQQIRQQQNFVENTKYRYRTGPRRLGIISLSASLIGLGIYRMFN